MKATERKRRVQIGKLTSVGRVAIEIGRLYRHARRGEIDTIEAYRLASVLGVMAKCLETTEFESRISEMEAAIVSGGNEQHFRPKVAA
jgi:hypothetical protein